MRFANRGVCKSVSFQRRVVGTAHTQQHRANRRVWGTDGAKPTPRDAAILARLSKKGDGRGNRGAAQFFKPFSLRDATQSVVETYCAFTQLSFYPSPEKFVVATASYAFFFLSFIFFIFFVYLHRYELVKRSTEVRNKAIVRFFFFSRTSASLPACTASNRSTKRSNLDLYSRTPPAHVFLKLSNRWSSSTRGTLFSCSNAGRAAERNGKASSSHFSLLERPFLVGEQLHASFIVRQFQSLPWLLLLDSLPRRL